MATASSSIPPQLVLDLAGTAVVDSLRGFVAGGNELALASVRALAHASGDGPAQLLLQGPAGTGKSHLLRGACHDLAAARAASAAVLPAGEGAEPASRAGPAAGLRGEASSAPRGTGAPPRTTAALRIVYVPLARRHALTTAMLADLDDSELIAIDDVDAVAGDPSWERALLLVVHARLLSGRRLLLSSGASLEVAGFRLPDLESRLLSVLRIGLRPLDEDGCRSLLRSRAAARGFDFGEDALDFTLKRVARDVPSLLRLLDRIDRWSLAAKRRVTVPLLREVLAAGEDPL